MVDMECSAECTDITATGTNITSPKGPAVFVCANIMSENEVRDVVSAWQDSEWGIDGNHSSTSIALVRRHETVLPFYAFPIVSPKTRAYYMIHKKEI